MSKWVYVKIQTIGDYAVEVDEGDSTGDAEQVALDETVWYDGDSCVMESRIIDNLEEQERLTRLVDKTLAL